MPPVTSRVPGNGTGTVTYTIPGSGLDVETVRVSVDASAAGGPVTATVTITDQSGVVIATKPQNATIPAGAIGSATWALRLDDELAATGGSGIQFDTDPQAGTYLVVTTTGSNFAGNGMTFHTLNGNPLELRSGSLFMFAEDQGFALGTIVMTNFGGDTFNIQALGGGDLSLQADPGGIELRTADRVEVNLRAVGSQLVVNDHFGNAIFETREDGSIHGRAAVGAITWDL